MFLCWLWHCITIALHTHSTARGNRSFAHNLICLNSREWHVRCKSSGKSGHSKLKLPTQCQSCRRPHLHNWNLVLRLDFCLRGNLPAAVTIKTWINIPTSFCMSQCSFRLFPLLPLYIIHRILPHLISLCTWRHVALPFSFSGTQTSHLHSYNSAYATK